MNKIIYYAIVVFIMVSFVGIMNSGNYLKKSFTATDDVPGYIDMLRDNLNTREWDKAETNYTALEKAWEEVVPRIQFSVEKDEMKDIYVNLARLEVYVDNQDSALAMSELNEIKQHWNHLNQ